MVAVMNWGCTCKLFNNTCNELCTGSHCLYSSLFYKSRHGQYLSYKTLSFDVKITAQLTQNGITWNNNITKYDLIPDCAPYDPLWKSSPINDAFVKCQLFCQYLVFLAPPSVTI